MAKTKQPKRGGKRPGAGRPPADPSGAKRPCTIWLTPAERQRLERIGGGSAADGLRRLIATA